MTELCACEANAMCKAQEATFLTCVSMAMTQMQEDGCAADFATQSNPTGGGVAGDLASCVVTDTNCASICQGKDGGVPRRRP
jgi:hypothetical protein